MTDRFTLSRAWSGAFTWLQRLSSTSGTSPTGPPGADVAGTARAAQVLACGRATLPVVLAESIPAKCSFSTNSRRLPEPAPWPLLCKHRRHGHRVGGRRSPGYRRSARSTRRVVLTGAHNDGL